MHTTDSTVLSLLSRSCRGPGQRRARLALPRAAPAAARSSPTRSPSVTELSALLERPAVIAAQRSVDFLGATMTEGL